MGARDRLEAYLREHHVPFELRHHRAAYTAQEVAASEHVPGRRFAKVVLAEADGRPVMLVVAAPDHVDLERAARLTGAGELRLLGEREIAGQFSDCEVGAAPPFGTLYGVPVFVDDALTREDTIYVQAGSHSEALALRCDDFLRVERPVTGALAVR
jgi:Ala-tRNA(Pro) deacylase